VSKGKRRLMSHPQKATYLRANRHLPASLPAAERQLSWLPSWESASSSSSSDGRSSSLRFVTWKRRSRGTYLESVDGRFQIVPTYRSTVKPDMYRLEDRKTGYTHWCFLVRDAKALAEQIVRDELSPPPATPTITSGML